MAQSSKPPQDCGEGNATTQAEASRRSFRVPPVTVSQMVLVPLLIGILCGYWFVLVDPTTQGIHQIFLANKKPRVAIFGYNSVRFVDAELNREICRSELEPQYPPTNRVDSSQWYRWPNRGNLHSSFFGEFLPFFQRVDGLEFLSEDSIAIVTQGDRINDRKHTIVHLPSGKRYVHEERTRANYSPMEFAKINGFIVGVQRQDGPDAVDAPLGFPPAEGHKSLIGEVILAIDPQSGLVEISEAQRKRVLNAFAVRRWQYNRGIWNSEPIKISKEDQDAANSDHDIEFCERDSKPSSWMTSAGQWIEYADPGDIDSDSTSKYWLAESRSAPLKRVAWPFKAGEVFKRSSSVPNEPAVCGIVQSANFPSMQIAEESVYWNLQSGQIIQLPGAVSDARQFGDRLLVCNSDGAAWVDLKTSKLSKSVINLDSTRHPRFVYAVALWIAAWLFCVRPMREGDLSRRFGVCFLLLSIAAISISQWDDIGMHFDWPQAEWLATCAMVFLLLAILVTVSIRRCVSWLLLGSAWSITLFFVVSLAVESSTEVYDSTGASPFGGLSKPTTLRASIWRHLTDPDGFDSARLDPAETAHLGTISYGEPNFGVKRMDESE